MAQESPFAGCEHYRPRATVVYRGASLPARFADAAVELAAADSGAALVDRSDRGLVRVTGRDRKAWLHNLVTNAVKTLDDDAGNYAFAIDVRGRTQFDLNILSLADELLLDIDVEWLPAAMKHLDRYLISEDVTLADVSGRHARLGVCGAQAARVAEGLGAGQFGALPSLASRRLADGAARLVRHDFCGAAGFELIMPREQACVWSDRLAGALGATPIGFETVDYLRIVAGIPWSGRDIDEKVIPPETGQVERGISYHKGCYLGQEVLERMRSHNALARRLVRLCMDDGAGIEPPVPLRDESSAEVGRITSLVRDLRGSGWVGLGYLRTTGVKPGALTAGDTSRTLTVAQL